MTDNEIIKALECCYTTGTSCEECPMYNFDECNDVLMAKYVRDLINRQQSEIERLEHENTELNAENTFLTSTLQNVTASTINEFVDRLKEHKHECGCNYRKKPVYAVTEEKIDNLVKKWQVIRNEFDCKM